MPEETLEWPCAPPSTAPALAALAALERRLAADARQIIDDATPPFARPTGATLYEADALTWRARHVLLEAIAYEVNFGARAEGARLRAALGLPRAGRISVPALSARLLALRTALRAHGARRSAD